MDGAQGLVPHGKAVGASGEVWNRKGPVFIGDGIVGMIKYMNESGHKRVFIAGDGHEAWLLYDLHYAF